MDYEFEDKNDAFEQSKARRNMEPFELCMDNIRQSLDLLFPLYDYSVRTSTEQNIPKIPKTFKQIKHMNPNIFGFSLLLFSISRDFTEIINDKYLSIDNLKNVTKSMGIQTKNYGSLIKNIATYYFAISKILT